MHVHLQMQLGTPLGLGLASQEAHDSARLEEWFVFEGKPRLNVDAGLSQNLLALGPPPVCTNGAAQPVPCNHDPPPKGSLRPRAPPV